MPTDALIPLLPFAAFVIIGLADLLGRGLGERAHWIGVPAVLGAGGVEKVIEMKLGQAEKEMLEVSAKAVREVVALLPY